VRRAASANLAIMLALTAVVFLVGAIQKAPCAQRSWVEDRQGVSIQCYSDVGQLLYNEQLLSGRLPYLDACAPSAVGCDEYPPLTMYVMRLTAWIPGEGDPYWRFYWANTSILFVCALATTALLERMGAATLLFAAAPALAIYGTMNWDLIPVALTTAATLAFLRGRRGTAGLLLGIGAAAKVYPAFVLIPFAGQLLHDRQQRDALRLVFSAVGAWVVLNLPFVIAAPAQWWNFFKFNADRPADHGTLWRVVCESGLCPSPHVMNLLSVGLAVGGTALIWRTLARRVPDFPRWAMAFPLLVLFFLSSKVVSSQYILWILPWFALVAPTFLPYALEQVTEVLAYVVTFSFFSGIQGGSGLPYGTVAAALILRAAALAFCVAAWFRTMVRSDLSSQAFLARAAPGAPP